MELKTCPFCSWKLYFLDLKLVAEIYQLICGILARCSLTDKLPVDQRETSFYDFKSAYRPDIFIIVSYFQLWPQCYFNKNVSFLQ